MDDETRGQKRTVDGRMLTSAVEGSQILVVAGQGDDETTFIYDHGVIAHFIPRIDNMLAKECQESKEKRIDMSMFTPSQWEEVHEFIIHPREARLNLKNVYSLVPLFSYLEVPKLMVECDNLISQDLHSKFLAKATAADSSEDEKDDGDEEAEESKREKLREAEDKLLKSLDFLSELGVCGMKKSNKVAWSMVMSGLQEIPQVVDLEVSQKIVGSLDSLPFEQANDFLSKYAPAVPLPTSQDALHLIMRNVLLPDFLVRSFREETIKKLLSTLPKDFEDYTAGKDGNHLFSCELHNFLAKWSKLNRLVGAKIVDPR